MSFILGIDVGSKRVGVAIADDQLKLPTPIGTFARARGQAEQEILRLVKDYQVSLLVVGLPLGSRQQETRQCQAVTAFAKRLSKRSELKIVYVDEYCSSTQAEDLLLEVKGRRLSLRQRGAVDAMAATIILDNYFVLAAKDR